MSTKEKLPTYVSLMNLAKMSPVLDQGSYGSCVENALSTMLSLQMVQGGKEDVPISRLQSYADTRLFQNDFDQDNGSKTGVTLAMAVSKGLASEKSWAYTESMYTIPTAEVYAEAAQHKLLGFTRLEEAQQIKGLQQDMKGYLMQGKPIMLSFEVGDYFFNEWGPLDTIIGHGTEGFPGGGHCVAIVGMDDNLNGGSYIIKNSWGTSWGDNGYGVISYSQFPIAGNQFHSAYVLNGFDGQDYTYSAARVNVAKYYATILERAPEVAGMDLWASQKGMTNLQLTTHLLDSAEGQALYGNTTNTQFVEELYDNIVGRHSDEGGLNLYVGLLDSGTSRAWLANTLIEYLSNIKSDPTDHQYLMNKVNVASYISIAVQYAGGQDAVTHDYLEQVTADVNYTEILKIGIPDIL